MRLNHQPPFLLLRYKYAKNSIKYSNNPVTNRAPPLDVKMLIVSVNDSINEPVKIKKIPPSTSNPGIPKTTALKIKLAEVFNKIHQKHVFFNWLNSLWVSLVSKKDFLIIFDTPTKDTLPFINWESIGKKIYYILHDIYNSIKGRETTFLPPSLFVFSTSPFHNIKERNLLKTTDIVMEWGDNEFF